MRLIVNADDFGYSPGQNYGVIDAFQRGIVRSASLMAQGIAAGQAAELARANPGLGVGVHLVLDFGRPVSPPGDVPTLVDDEGKFLRFDINQPLRHDLAEVEREWRAQIRRVLDLGLEPTHLDGHHHVHMHPQLWPVTRALAREFDLPIRAMPRGWEAGAAYAGRAEIRHPQVCLVDFYGDGVREEFFTEFFVNYPDLRDKTVEVMSHPAYVDDFILANSSYNFPRVRELQVLTSPRVLAWVEQNGVELINYRQL